MRDNFWIGSAGCHTERLFVDFIRYAAVLVIFLGASFVLMFSVHLLVLWHTKRKNAALPVREK